MWADQNSRVKANVNIRPDVDTSTLTVKQLGLTRVDGPCYIGYCSTNERLGTFSYASIFTPWEATVLAAKGCFEDVTNPGRIRCFCCPLDAHVASINLPDVDRMHEENGCAFFSLYLSCVCAQGDGPPQTVGANSSTRLICKFTLLDCQHTHYYAFDCFPECFMSKPDGSGTLCCPECQHKITVLHLLPNQNLQLAEL